MPFNRKLTSMMWPRRKLLNLVVVNVFVFIMVVMYVLDCSSTTQGAGGAFIEDRDDAATMGAEEAVRGGLQYYLSEEESTYILQQQSTRANVLLWDKYQTPAIGRDQSDPERFLIARCDESMMSNCGGWDNRVNGLVLTYLMANLTGRTFKFEHLKPSGCDLTRYLIPNEVNWYLEQSFHKTVVSSEDVDLVIKSGDNKFLNSLPTMNFKTLFQPKKPHIYFLGDRNFELRIKCSDVYKHELSWMKDLTRGEIKAAVFKRLFKLSPYLQAKTNDFLARKLPTKRHRLICAHLRMGKNPSNKYDGPLQTMENLKPVWELMNNKSKSDFDKVFIMSDSDEVIQSAKAQRFSKRLILTNGPIVHVDKFQGKSQEEACSGLEKVLMDQHILSSCDVLMVGNSGISRLAAYIRGTDLDLYCHLPDGKVIPCTRYNFDFVTPSNGQGTLDENC